MRARIPLCVCVCFLQINCYLCPVPEWLIIVLLVLMHFALAGLLILLIYLLCIRPVQREAQDKRFDKCMSSGPGARLGDTQIWFIPMWHFHDNDLGSCQ